MGAGLHLQTLTRAQGALIRQLLRDKTVRSKEGAFVVEGATHCLDLISQHPQAIRSLLISPSYLRIECDADRTTRLKLQGRQFLCSDLVFQRLTDVETPQGILAVVQQPQWDEGHIFRRSRVLGIYGDRLRDPANVGAIIRTAAALDLSGVWLSHDSVDHFSPKVVRATAGTLLALPVFYTRDIRTFALHGCELYSALLPTADSVPLRNIRTIPSRLLFAVGNEGTGLSQDVVKASSIRFFIPLAEGVESLNVAASVAISAFYFSGLPNDSHVPIRSSS